MSSKRIISTMAKTASMPRGSTPPLSTPLKRHKQDGTDDASNEQKRQKIPTTMPKAKRRWTTPHAKQAL
jgi:hypothetical protein